MCSGINCRGTTRAIYSGLQPAALIGYRYGDEIGGYWEEPIDDNFGTMSPATPTMPKALPSGTLRPLPSRLGCCSAAV